MPGNDRRWLIGVAIVLGIAGVLAWQAHAAGRAHRAALEQVVRDHADFAGWLLVTRARETLELRALYGFAPVLRSAPVEASLPPAAALGTDPTERRRCPLPGTDSTRIYARLRIRDRDLETAGPVPDELAGWLADTLLVLSRSTEQGVRHAVRSATGGLWAWLVARDGEGQPLAVYAANGCLAMGEATVLDVAWGSTDALPPSLTAGLPNDSLMTGRLMAGGRELWHSPGAWDDTFTGTSGPVPSLGGAELEVSIHPDAVERLIVGGMPPSRLPLALALLGLAGALAGLAVVQVNRQLALARTRERFLRNASHELRTPLQQILLFADLLRLGRLDEGAERKRALDVIDAETRRLIHTVDGVLRFTRGEPVAPASAQAHRLAPIVGAAVDAFRPLAQSREATVALETDPDATACVAPDAVRQVVVNLLDNAVKYGPRGQTVRVRMHARNGHVELTVDDAGPGVPADERERVFTPFHRLERDERGNTPGTGIGLAIVRDLVRRDEGDVRVDDAPGGGARFVVRWPAA